MAAAPDLSQIPPSDIPDALQDGIAKLSAPLKQLLMMKSVPYLIQHRLGSENYVTVEDLADRWDSAQVARQQGPRELGFEADHNGFTAASSGFAAMKLFQVVRAAKEMIQTHPSVLATPGPGPSRPLSLTEVLCERPQLEKEFSAKWGIPKPQYRDQGSDALLRRQYKFCSKGEIGFIHSKYIISALPEEGERPIKTRKKITVDGWEKEEEEEERAAPTTRRQLERLHLVFRNTLLMCLAAFPQFPQFNLTKEDLDSFYDWFYGPELGGRRPSPPEQTLLMAERNAWREVHESMHGGMYLKEALEKVQNNSLFWMREVYERVISERAKGKSKKGKDKKGSWGYPIRQPLWEKKGKGHGDKGGKGKGKGKSKPSDWPSNWAFKNPKGVPFCRDYFIKKTCQGQCGRSHNCPVVNSEGWVCNAGPKEHKPENCPHKAWRDRTAANGAVEHPGNQEGGNVIQDDIGAAGTQASTTVCGREPPGTGGAPDSSRTVSPNAPNLALGTAADGAVAPRREGEHPSQTGGSPAFPRTRGQNDSNPSLGTAANGAETPRKTGVHSKRVRPAEPAASQPGKSAKHSNLTGRSLGQGISFQNQMSSGSELSEAYSWLRYVPNRLRQRVLPTVAQGAFNPGPVLVLLYAGKDDPLSLDSCLHAHYPRLSPYVVAFDTRRSPQPLGHDLLTDQPYGKLCQAAIEGRVRLVCGGPNCRTWSILRWFPKPNAPLPVRGRAEDLVWGLPTLTDQEQEEVDGESLLILRQMFLTTLMKQNCSLPVASFLEHPRDPIECSSSPSASRCSSLWATKMFKAWYPTVGHTLVKFDQCRLGQLVPKATCLSSDLAIQCWDGLSCNHPPHKLPEDMQSSDLSRYPPPMMQGLAGAISQALSDIGQEVSKPTANWTHQHPSANDELPFRQQVRHMDHGVDRPTSLPLAHRISLMDEHVVVQLGFRTRPLRDGGGKPSPGRLVPPLRKNTGITSLGSQIIDITSEFNQAVQMSISCGEKNHPFSDVALRNIRQCLGATPEDGIAEGQPFFLTLISRLAKASGDPDWKYPLTLQEGVPIGVDEPTLTSPGVWPTKEELRGSPDDWEDLPSPTGRHNYDSAEAFSDSIKETFIEEKAMGLVEGPFTKQEAADRCGCNPSELCPGPMAAIDEGDKIRTIYDGSFGGANAHIQQNSTEKTTAPTVMDCVHGIHWLRAAREVSTAESAPQEQRATADGVDPMAKGSVWHWPDKDSTFLLLKADVSKAHRRIKILRSGWKYQVAQIDQQWWVNKVGTYGVASAQLYWGRMAALLLRILYALFPEVDWGFVFVDDFCWVLRVSNASWLTPALLGVLLALGTPLSWKKTVLSEINTWLGFVINPSGPFVQMAKDKHVAVLKLLKELEEGKAFSLKAIEKALGKIQWATATCPMAKPFLQPFWAWKSAVKTAGVPGKLVRCLAVLLSQLFSKQFPQMSPFSPWSSWTGASDASAEKEGESWIGGWLTDSPEPSKDKVLWFQYKVCQEHHPWAFKKNDPQKRIAALELYGTLFLALMLMAQNPSTSCRLHIPLVSDNQGNVYSILNNATRKMPTAVILMELVYQLYQAGHMLAPAHSRRDDNQWADELTHPNPKGFDPALRVDLTPYFHKLALIPKILEAGDTALWQDNMDTHLWPFWGRVGPGSRTRWPLPAAADGAVMGG